MGFYQCVNLLKFFLLLIVFEGFYKNVCFTGYWRVQRPDLFQEPDSMFLHFQLDASASTPGFMAEMLLQSHLGELILLPALPSAWPEGHMTGLKARGGFELDISWRKGRLHKAVITCPQGRMPVVRVGRELVDPKKDPRIELITAL